MTKAVKPTDAELEILNVLWKDGPSTVRHVNEVLTSIKKVGYTTTLKTMQIMFEKGILEREQKGRGHVYSAVHAKEETQELLLDRVISGVFGGSALKLVMQALGNRKTSKQELAEIKQYLDQLEEQK